MDSWRVIPLETNDAYMNTALDEVATNYAFKLGQPLLRFYEWKPKGVSLGTFQTTDDLDPNKCKFYNFDVVRRETGGKATVHMFGVDICYSLAVPLSAFDEHLNIIDKYKYFCSKIANALTNIGVKDLTVKSNDIFARNMKISGNASRSKIGSYMQHGFIFYSQPEIQLILSLINKKAVRNWSTLRGEEEITSILSNVTVSKKEFCNEVIKCITDNKYKLSSWTKDELSEAEALIKNKYKTRAWMDKGKQHKGLCYMIWR